MSIAQIFELKDITLAQAAALLVLSKIYSGNFQKESYEFDRKSKSEDKSKTEDDILPPIKRLSN